MDESILRAIASAAGVVLYGLLLEAWRKRRAANGAGKAERPGDLGRRLGRQWGRACRHLLRKCLRKHP